MASGSKVAVANCSTYIQGCVSWDANVNSSGNIVVNVRFYMRRTNNYSGSTYSSSVTQYINISGDANAWNYSQTTALTVAGGQQNTWQGPYFTASRTFDGSRGGDTIYVGWKTVENYVSGYLGGSGNVAITLPQGYTDPSGLNVSVNSVGTNSANLYVSLSSYGNPSSANNRYIEAAVLNQNSYGATYRYAIAFNTTSANIDVTNSGGGTLNIQPNTQYYYGAYASNTQRSINTVKGTLVTLPPALSAKSATVTGTNSIRINYTTAADGGKYTKNIQYSLNNSSWTTGATVSSGSSSSGNFTISGLSAGTAYTIYLRVNTSAGTTGSGSVSATTYKVPANATVSASNTSASANSVTYGVSTFNVGGNPGVYLYGGTSASPTTQLTWKSTTGNATYTHSGLTGNTKYYYRSRAKNDGGWSAYSSDATATTKPAAPTLTVSSIKHNSASIAIKSPSQGSANTMTAYYTVNGGSATSAGTVSSNGTTTRSLTNLTPGTSYTIVAYLNTSAGSSTTVTQTFTTPLPFYVPVNSQTKYAKKLYCSVNGQTKKVIHLYGSVNGVTKKIF